MPPSRVQTAAGIVPLTGVQTIDALLWGTKWLASQITYSSPDSTSDYEPGYPTMWFEGFSRLTATQLTAVHSILDESPRGQLPGARHLSVEAFTNLGIDFVGGGSGAGTIRLANSGLTDFSAIASFPNTPIDGGDIRFGKIYGQHTPVTGNHDNMALIHELGHALGLKHAQDPRNVNGANAPVLPYDTDTMEYSLMSYRSYRGDNRTGPENETWGFPQTFMMYDIRALQHLYGADFTANGGDTVYRWSPTGGETYINGQLALDPGGNRILMTIWDGNGNDTYDLSNYSTDVRINLAPGGFSIFSAAQLAKLSQPSAFTPEYFARGNVFNALQYNGDARSLIENAIGGSGNDIIGGNAAANRLYGGAGNDTLLGGVGGDDTFYGGAGRDVITSGVNDNTAYGGGGHDWITGNSFDDILFGDLGDDTLLGQSGEDSLYGGGGDDVLDGGSGADFEYGGDGDDRFLLNTNLGDGNTFDGGAGRDVLDLTGIGGSASAVTIILDSHISGLGGASTITGVEDVWGSSGASEWIYGGAAANRLYGNGGADVLDGQGGNDSLYGGDGNDWVFDASGADILVGGAGADLLIGGTGNDTFVFETLAASSPTEWDLLIPGNGAVAFQAPGSGAGDRIDVSAIDANAAATGNQAFKWGGFNPGAANKANGWLWAEEDGADTVILGNVDGDAEAEFKVVILDADGRGSAYRAADFIL